MVQIVINYDEGTGLIDMNSSGVVITPVELVGILDVAKSMVLNDINSTIPEDFQEEAKPTKKKKYNA